MFWLNADPALEDQVAAEPLAEYFEGFAKTGANEWTLSGIWVCPSSGRRTVVVGGDTSHHATGRCAAWSYGYFVEVFRNYSPVAANALTPPRGFFARRILMTDNTHYIFGMGRRQ